ncbi:sensor histidine kinase [Frigidibacter sp. MR17.24]|uniref:sensor histidine kinase n=1 Tax=Frigidibacter sp. MR17.24 TaxID=3127345 RepID=UPI003012B864
MTIAHRPKDASAKAGRDSGLVLGEDWVAPGLETESELREGRAKRGVLSLNRSPLARKIITFNLMAMIVMVAGVLFLNPFRDSLVAQRERDMIGEARLIGNVFEARHGTDTAPWSAEALTDTLSNIALPQGATLFLFDAQGNPLISSREIATRPLDPVPGLTERHRSTAITDFLSSVWNGLAELLGPRVDTERRFDIGQLSGELASQALTGTTQVRNIREGTEGTVFIVAEPVVRDGRILGAIAVSSGAGAIDALVRAEREQVLEMFLIAIAISIALSLVLASTIANPLADLAIAAELGRDRNARKMNPGRVRIPDLTGRPDEIGRLSGAMRGMVTALYDRIDANEQFAADVSHEIKNPLASLRSAVGTMRVAKRDDQREKLLEVIEHDVRRLDRLVSDISNASRLDSELVRDEEEEFDLLRTIGNINEYLSQQAAERGVDYITDLPAGPITITGLEARLAQVFVNLITNAISFCEEGDAVRVWVRRRDNRVLVVVEDTGPGIPETALTKIFKRFYSERPVGQFGEHSGLGLAISKQIVEAHAGVIWAENIRPTEADITSEPLGARFVVGLPV